jgi:small GTP-binding protein
MEIKIPKYKITFLGDQSVGKTSIMNRFLNDTFVEEYQATIGLDFQSKTVDINETNIHFLLYDIAGKEKFRNLIPIYARDTNIYVFIYEITNKESFVHIENWLEEITIVNKLDCILVLIGNKKDLENNRAVTLKEGEDFAKEKGFIFSEVSSKTGEGINDLFYNKLFNEMIKKKFIIKKDAKEGSDNGNNNLQEFVKIAFKLNEENDKKEETEQDNSNNSELENKFNIGNNEKDSVEIINDLINQNNEIKLDENIMIDPKNKCYSKGHEEIMPNYYCPQCKIYMCKKCEISHSDLFYQKNHILINLDKDKEINDIFTGYCKENNHLEKLEYFCKTHNKLCCSSCIVKIKREGKGQHTDCDICLIENIKDEKNKIFKKIIESLEEL